MWCDKKISTKKQKLGIIETHSQISQLENNFYREITWKMKKNVKIWKIYSIFLQIFCWFFEVSDSQMAQKPLETNFKLSLSKLL